MSLVKSIKIFGILLALMISCNSANPVFAYNTQAVQIYNDAVDMSKNGNFQEAINLFKKALIVDPTFVDAYYNLASIYEYLGNEVQALTYYEIVLSKAPGDADVAYKVASIYHKKKEFDKALNYLRSISNDNPKYAAAQDLKKRINQEIEKINQAKLAYSNQSVDISQTALYSKSVYKEMQGPTGITQDGYGNLYIANYTANLIIKIDPQGKRSTFAKGSPLNGPIGLVADPLNNIYVANYVSNEILKITPDGKTNVLLKGVNKPYYLYLDKYGMLYISEQGSNTVIKIKII